MSGESSGKIDAMTKGLSRRSLMTATALASMAALAGCGGGDGGGVAPAPIAPPPPPPPPPPPAPVTSKFLYSANDAAANVAVGAYLVDATTGALMARTSPIATTANASSIVAHPTGKWIYVADQTTLSQFSVDQTTGVVTLVVTAPAFTNTVAGTTIDITPSGKFLFVSLNDIGAIAKYSIDPSTGVPTRIFEFSTGGTGLQNGFPLFLKVHPNGNFLYASENGVGNIYAIAIGSDGELSASPTNYPALTPSQMVFNSAGTMMYTSTNNSVFGYPVNPTTGALGTSITPRSTPTGTTPSRFAISPNGLFLYSNDSAPGIAVYGINSDGTLLPVTLPSGLSTTAGASTAIAINYTGTKLYSASPGANKIDVFTIATDGTLGTFIQSLSAPNAPRALAIANF